MKLPVTRYYGSKRKLVDKIWAILEQEGVEFDSFLDLFGGTGIVSYYMAHKGKNVIYNDILLFNCRINLFLYFKISLFSESLLEHRYPRCFIIC